MAAVIRWLEPSPVRWLGALPSSESAEELVGGDLAALPKVAFHTGVRAGLIGAALYVAGMRGAGNLVKYSVAGALGIEAFVLLWALYERAQEKKQEVSAEAPTTTRQLPAGRTTPVPAPTSSTPTQYGLPAHE